MTKKSLLKIAVCVALTAVVTACLKDIGYCYLSVKSENENMGSVTGSGSYAKGSQATLIAKANNGCDFTRWSDGSHDNPHYVTVNRNMEYIAYFGTAVVQFGDRTWLPNNVFLELSGNNVFGTITSDNTCPKIMFMCHYKGKYNKAENIGFISYDDDEYYEDEDLSCGLWSFSSGTATFTKYDLKTFETSFEINATMVGSSNGGHYGEYQRLTIRLTDMHFDII